MKRTLSLFATGILLATLLAFSPPAAAQDLTGPPLTAQTPLYGHASGTANRWMSTIKVDPAAPDQTATLAFPGPATLTPASFKLLPELSAPMYLDPAGKVKFNLRVGSGLLFNVGQFTTELRAGTTLIASAAGPANDPIVSAYKGMDLTATPLVTTITPEMGNLVWTISFSGSGTAYIQISQNSQWCNLVLPILPPPEPAETGPELIVENLTGPSVDFTHTHANATNDTYQYQWASPGGDLELSLNASVDGGAVAYSLVDETNQTLAEGVIEATGVVLAPLASSPAGNWTLRLAYAEYAGLLNVKIMEAIPPDPLDGPPTSVPSTASGKASDAPASDGGVPGPSLVWLLAALGAILLARRGRRPA